MPEQQAKPNSQILLATAPQRLPTRTRACGFWVSAFAEESFVIDTRALPEFFKRHNPAGDAIPADCLLVVVSPQTNAALTKKAEETPYPISGPWMAARLIDDICHAVPGLAAMFDWSMAH